MALVTGSELIRGEPAGLGGGRFWPQSDAAWPPAVVDQDLVGAPPHGLPSVRSGRLTSLALSGALGRTQATTALVHVVPRAAELEAVGLCRSLSREIEGVSRRIAERWPAVCGVRGRRSQAGHGRRGWTRDWGRGTAPSRRDGAPPVAVVLPGPPPELRRLWQAALDGTAGVRLARAKPRRAPRAAACLSGELPERRACTRRGRGRAEGVPGGPSARTPGVSGSSSLG